MKKSKFSKTKAGKKGKGSGGGITAPPAFSMSIFGVPLESISQYDPEKGWGLPPLIQRALQRIRLDTKQEGIFRLSAPASQVNDLRAAYNSGNAVDLSQVESNVCCGLLKLFLREMPEPLFPFRLYKAFVSFQEDSFERDKEYIKILLSNLAGPRKPLFFELFRLLHDVSKESEHNLMDASNLAVVIGPTVLRCESSDLKTQLADATSVNEATATFISHFDELEEPCTESFLAVAEATKSYTDDASGLHWKEGDVFFLRKELDDNAWLASFRGEEGQIPAEKFKMLTFLDLGKGVQAATQSEEISESDPVSSDSFLAQEVQEEVQEAQEDADSQTIEALIGFCAQSCMVMHQMQEENEHLRGAVKSLQSLTKSLIPLVPEASKTISSEEIDSLAKPLHCTSKSGIAFLNEQLQSIITAREKSLEESGKEGTPLASRRSIPLALKSHDSPCESPLSAEMVSEEPQSAQSPPPSPSKEKSDVDTPKKKKKKKSSETKGVVQTEEDATKKALGMSLDMQEVKEKSESNPAPIVEPETKRLPKPDPETRRSSLKPNASNRRAQMRHASHFSSPPLGSEEKLMESPDREEGENKEE